MSDPNDSTGTVSHYPNFLEFCTKVRNNDPSILPKPGDPLIIRDQLSEKERIELADALLENTNVTYLLLKTENYRKSSTEAMAKYIRTSKRLQRIRWYTIPDQKCEEMEEMLCCFLAAIQECTSLKELNMELPLQGKPSYLAFENMLAHTKCLRSLSLTYQNELEGPAVAAASSGLKRNTTLRELTLKVSLGATALSPIYTSLRDHPLLQRLCLWGYAMDLTGLETLLQTDTSKITELNIHQGQKSCRGYRVLPIMGLTLVLQALTRHPELVKLRLHRCRLGRDEVRLLQMVLCNVPSLQSLALTDGSLWRAEWAELAPTLYHNTSINVLDLSQNQLGSITCARLLRDILCSNKTLTALNLSSNQFGNDTAAVECIVDGMASNSTLIEIDLSRCNLGDGGISILTQALGSRNTRLQKLILLHNSITSTGVSVLLETMEANSHHITDLDLKSNPIGNEGASLLARSLGTNALPNLTRLSISHCDIDNDGFTTLVSALEQNISLLQLDLRHSIGLDLSERALLALAESLPEIKVLQQVDLRWCTGLASAMPLLLAGLRKNTSLFRFHVAGCAPWFVPPTRNSEEMAKFAGSGWIQEMERVGYRNRFLPLIRAPKERLPPRGIWPRVLVRVGRLPDVIFEVLRSKPNLVPFEDTAMKEAAKEAVVQTKCKRGDE
jgi:Ran GTPase-activating protein (RanGAP) involved in mRNA processing and transport